MDPLVTSSCNRVEEPSRSAGDTPELFKHIGLLFDESLPVRRRYATALSNAAEKSDALDLSTISEPLARFLCTVDRSYLVKPILDVVMRGGKTAERLVPALTSLLGRSFGELQGKVIETIGRLGSTAEAASPALFFLWVRSDDKGRDRLSGVIQNISPGNFDEMRNIWSRTVGTTVLAQNSAIAAICDNPLGEEHDDSRQCRILYSLAGALWSTQINELDRLNHAKQLKLVPMTVSTLAFLAEHQEGRDERLRAHICSTLARVGQEYTEFGIVLERVGFSLFQTLPGAGGDLLVNAALHDISLDRGIDFLQKCLINRHNSSLAADKLCCIVEKLHERTRSSIGLSCQSIADERIYSISRSLVDNLSPLLEDDCDFVLDTLGRVRTRADFIGRKLHQIASSPFDECSVSTVSSVCSIFVSAIQSPRSGSDLIWGIRGMRLALRNQDCFVRSVALDQVTKLGKEATRFSDDILAILTDPNPQYGKRLMSATKLLAEHLPEGSSFISSASRNIRELWIPSNNSPIERESAVAVKEILGVLEGDKGKRPFSLIGGVSKLWVVVKDFGVLIRDYISLIGDNSKGPTHPEFD